MAQWMNRVGARTMWAIGYCTFAIAAIANLLLSDFSVAIYLIRSALVMGAAIVFTSGLTYISQIAPEQRRAEAIGILGVGGFLGMLIGPFLGDIFLGELAEGSGQRERSGFVLFFAVAAGGNVISALILLFIRPPEKPTERVTIKLSAFVSTVRQHFPGGILLVDLAFGVCMTGPFIFVSSFIDRESIHVPGVSTIGLFFWFYAGPAIAIRLLGRRLPQRFGTRTVLLVGGVFMASGMFAFTLVHSGQAWKIIIPAILAGCGHGLMFHTMVALTLEKFATEVRATGSTLALMMLDLGTVAGAPALGEIGDRFGFAALFSTIGAFCLAATLLYALLSRPSVR